MSINVTRESRVKVFGRWVRVPNWVIVDRQWSTERKNRARDNAERLGRAQRRLDSARVWFMSGWAYPVAVAVVLVLALGTVGGLESR